MAYVDLRLNGRAPKDGSVHEINYRDATGRRRSQRFRYKKDALAFEAKVTLNVGGVRGRKQSEKISVDDAFERWIAFLRVHGGRSNDGASPSTIGGYESIHTRWISPGLGGYRLGKLDRDTVQDWQLSMVSATGSEPSPRQRGTADDQLVRLLSWCVRFPASRGHVCYVTQPA